MFGKESKENFRAEKSRQELNPEARNFFDGLFRVLDSIGEIEDIHCEGYKRDLLEEITNTLFTEDSTKEKDRYKLQEPYDPGELKENADEKDKIYFLIAKARFQMATKDLEGVRESLKNAFDLAKDIKYPPRWKLLSEIAEIQANINPEASRSIFQEAWQAAGTMDVREREEKFPDYGDVDYDRDEALKDLLCLQTKIDIQNTIDNIKNFVLPHERSEYLYTVAEIQADRNDLQGSRKTLQDAIDTSRKRDARWILMNSNMVFSAIAEKEAETDLEAALKTADEIQILSDHIVALANIARVRAEHGDVSESQRILEQCKELIKKIKPRKEGDFDVESRPRAKIVRAEIAQLKQILNDGVQRGEQIFTPERTITYLQERFPPFSIPFITKLYEKEDGLFYIFFNHEKLEQVSQERFLEIANIDPKLCWRLINFRELSKDAKPEEFESVRLALQPGNPRRETIDKYLEYTYDKSKETFFVELLIKNNLKRDIIENSPELEKSCRENGINLEGWDNLNNPKRAAAFIEKIEGLFSDDDSFKKEWQQLTSVPLESVLGSGNRVKMREIIRIYADEIVNLVYRHFPQADNFSGLEYFKQEGISYTLLNRDLSEAEVEAKTVLTDRGFQLLTQYRDGKPSFRAGMYIALVDNVPALVIDHLLDFSQPDKGGYTPHLRAGMIPSIGDVEEASHLGISRDSSELETEESSQHPQSEDIMLLFEELRGIAERMNIGPSNVYFYPSPNSWRPTEFKGIKPKTFFTEKLDPTWPEREWLNSKRIDASENKLDFHLESISTVLSTGAGRSLNRLRAMSQDHSKRDIDSEMARVKKQWAENGFPAEKIYEILENPERLTIMKPLGLIKVL